MFGNSAFDIVHTIIVDLYHCKDLDDLKWWSLGLRIWCPTFVLTLLLNVGMDHMFSFPFLWDRGSSGSSMWRLVCKRMDFRVSSLVEYGGSYMQHTTLNSHYTKLNSHTQNSILNIQNATTILIHKTQFSIHKTQSQCTKHNTHTQSSILYTQNSIRITQNSIAIYKTKYH